MTSQIVIEGGINQLDGIVRRISYRRPWKSTAVIHLIQGGASHGAQGDRFTAIFEPPKLWGHDSGIPVKYPRAAHPPLRLQHRRVFAYHRISPRGHYCPRRKRQGDSLTEITAGQIRWLGPRIVQFDVFTVHCRIVLIVVDLIDHHRLSEDAADREQQQSRHSTHLGKCEHSDILPWKRSTRKHEHHPFKESVAYGMPQ